MRARLAFFAVLLLGCHPKVTVNGIEVYESVWRDVESSVRYRAASDLNCAPEGIMVQLVRRQGRFPVEVYAEGCGGRAMYTRALRHHHGGWTDRNTTWVRQP